METVQCVLCGKERTHMVLTSTDRKSENPLVFQLVECEYCGLVFLNPRPSPEEIVRYYPENYGPHQPLRSWKPTDQNWIKQQIIYTIANLHYGTPTYGTTSKFFSTPGFRELMQILTNSIKPRLGPLPQFKSPGRFLDVGCGIGGYLDLVRDLGWMTYGVEINANAADFARTGGHNIAQGTLESAFWPSQYFQAASLWQTLEHLHNPFTTLEELYRIMAPGAELLIEVPNLYSNSASVFKQDWFALELPRHLYFFTAQTLHSLLIRAGFKPSKVKTLSSHFVIRRSQDYRDETRIKTGSTPLNQGRKRIEEWYLIYSGNLYRRGDLLQVTAMKI